MYTNQSTSKERKENLSKALGRGTDKGVSDSMPLLRILTGALGLNRRGIRVRVNRYSSLSSHKDVTLLIIVVFCLTSQGLEL